MDPDFPDIEAPTLYVWSDNDPAIGPAGAYTTEIMRAGIQSVQRTQLEAADCLGLTRLQTILHVVLLPAMERVYPALASQGVLLMLASSITSQISA